MNTTGYARGSKKLIAMSRKNIPPSDKIKRVWSTAILKSEEVISNWIITHYHILSGIANII